MRRWWQHFLEEKVPVSWTDILEKPFLVSSIEHTFHHYPIIQTRYSSSSTTIIFTLELKTFSHGMFFLLTLGVLVLSTIPQNKAEICEKTFGDSSKYQELFRVHFQSMDFKDCTDELNLKEKEITESSLQQVCVCMKTSLDISICETKADILLLGKCLACTQDSYHNCLNHNLKSPISQIIWGHKKKGNPNIPVIFAFTSGVGVAALVFLLTYSCLYRTRVNTVSGQDGMEMAGVHQNWITYKYPDSACNSIVYGILFYFF